MLGPHARTRPCGWWNQIVSSGRSRSISRAAIRVSGSDSGRGPGYSWWPPGLHSEGKLRLRSTPRPFWRRPRANPSGFRFGTSHRSTEGDERARIRVTAVPAHSSPWMQPTTRSRCSADRSPTRTASISLPLVERPSRIRAAGSGPIRRSEEHTSELQSHHDLVCRLLLEKKKKNIYLLTTKNKLKNELLN